MRLRYSGFNGFGGITVYDEMAGLRLSNVVRGGKTVIRSPLPKIASEPTRWSEFCKLVLRIRRPSDEKP